MGDDVAKSNNASRARMLDRRNIVVKKPAPPIEAATESQPSNRRVSSGDDGMRAAFNTIDNSGKLPMIV